MLSGYWKNKSKKNTWSGNQSLASRLPPQVLRSILHFVQFHPSDWLVTRNSRKIRSRPAGGRQAMGRKEERTGKPIFSFFLSFRRECNQGDISGRLCCTFVLGGRLWTLNRGSGLRQRRRGRVWWRRGGHVITIFQTSQSAGSTD